MNWIQKYLIFYLGGGTTIIKKSLITVYIILILNVNSLLKKTQQYEFGLTVSGTGQLFVDGKLVVDNKTKQTKGVAILNFGTIEERASIELQQGETYKITVDYVSAPTYTLKDQFAEYFGWWWCPSWYS